MQLFVEAGFSPPMRVEIHPSPAKAGIHMNLFWLFSKQEAKSGIGKR